MSHAADTVILATLLRAGEGFTSGSALAAKLGCSRVAVRGKLERLRSEGFGFEAVRNRGYRLTDSPGRIHPALLAARLLNAGVNAPLHYFETVGSTNTEAERLLAEGAEAPATVVGGRQQTGRGRLGRAWFSGDTGNLYLSLFFRPNLPPGRMQRFTLWMGVRLCAHLKDAWHAPVLVKWPNDLVYADAPERPGQSGAPPLRKLAGMLTEARIDADATRELVFGLGLNIAPDTAAWPPDIRALATALAEIVPPGAPPPEVNAVAAGVIAAALEAAEHFIGTGGDVPLAQAWPRCDALAGRHVHATLRSEALAGTAGGIDSTGALRLLSADGRTHTLHAGDVTLQPAR